MRGIVSTPGLMSVGVLSAPGAQGCPITKTTAPVSASALAASAAKATFAISTNFHIIFFTQNKPPDVLWDIKHVIG
jgi:hypothetical protein